MDRQPVLAGENVMLRPLVEADREALYQVASDPLIWEVHPAHDRWQRAVFDAFFADALAQGGALAIVERPGGATIGSSRFQNYAPATGGSVEIGWTFLARSHWGGSANREVKWLMLGHALANVERAFFTVGEHNLRSRRAMEKIGGRLTDWRETRVMAGREVAHVRYEITRDSFASGPLAR